MGIAGAACLWEASSGHLCLPPQMPGSVPISKGFQPDRPPLAALNPRAHGSYRIQSWKDPGLMSHSLLRPPLDEVRTLRNAWRWRVFERVMASATLNSATFGLGMAWWTLGKRAEPG